MIRSAILLFAMLQSGKFGNGYEAENHGVGINIVLVRDGPGCRERHDCSTWMLQWSSKRNIESADISITVAGKDRPALTVTVPGRKTAKLDEHNPIFEIPLQTVSGIEFTLRNGTKEVGHAAF